MRLQQEFDRVFIRKFNLHQNIGRKLHGSVFEVFVRRLLSIFLSLNNDILRRDKCIQFETVRQRGIVSEHGYLDKYGDLRSAVTYANEISDPNFSKDSLGESYILYQEQLISLRELLKNGGIRKVFNFGVCYAYIDSVLAREFPDVEFWGIDLSPHVKAFNDCEFSHIENLKIFTGDMFKIFEKNDFSDCVLIHSRTLVLLPSSFIDKLYCFAYKSGFKYIYGFEQHGLSEETRSPFTFDLENRPSIYWRDRMYVHNYLGIANKCGFDILSADNFSTGHTSPDLKILRFLAIRR